MTVGGTIPYARNPGLYSSGKRQLSMRSPPLFPDCGCSRNSCSHVLMLSFPSDDGLYLARCAKIKPSSLQLLSSRCFYPRHKLRHSGNSPDSFHIHSSWKNTCQQNTTFRRLLEKLKDRSSLCTLKSYFQLPTLDYGLKIKGKFRGHS